MAQNASPGAQNGLKTLVWASQMVQGHFWKNALLTLFCPSFCPRTAHFSRHFGIFHGPKRATTGSKRAKNACLSIPSGLGTTLEKMIFFDPGTLVDPPVAPTVRGPGCPPAPPSDHWYGGLSGSLGDSKGWKPQKVGGCGWTRCPRRFGFEPRSPRYGPFLVLAVLDRNKARLGHFWPFLGRFSDILWS